MPSVQLYPKGDRSFSRREKTDVIVDYKMPNDILPYGRPQRSHYLTL